jgi:hypothetical protein
MIVSKYKILITFTNTYAPNKANEQRFHEVANNLGIEPEAVKQVVLEFWGHENMQGSH